jgi:hypothetical protein
MLIKMIEDSMSRLAVNPTTCNVLQNLFLNGEVTAPGEKHSILLTHRDVESLHPFREKTSMVQGRVSANAGTLFTIEFKPTKSI